MQKNVRPARVLILALLSAGVAVACGSNSPTSPPASATESATGASTAPMISGLSPASPNAASAAQVVTVMGGGFSPGDSLILKGPGTGATIYMPPDTSNVSSSSFDTRLVINVAGNWTATVRGTDGQDTAQFPFTVHVTPEVSAVTSSVARHDIPQTITVTGKDFLPGLSFVVKGPDTGAMKHSGADVSSLTSTSFRGTAIFPIAGGWSVTVINPDGYTSREVAFVVK